MEHRVLGKLEVGRDGEAVGLGTRRRRSLLALLLADPNTVWSSDRIVNSLWSGWSSALPGRQQSPLAERTE